MLNVKNESLFHISIRIKMTEPILFLTANSESETLKSQRRDAPVTTRSRGGCFHVWFGLFQTRMKQNCAVISTGTITLRSNSHQEAISSALSSPLIPSNQFILYIHKSLGSRAPSLRRHIPHSKKMTHACVCVCV